MRTTVWLLLLAAVAAPDQPAPLKTTLQEFVDRGEVAGVVAVTGRSTGVTQTEVAGLADVASGRAMAPDTMFRIASMTKPITAAGIMILVDDGKIAVDDPLEKHLPEFRGLMLVTSKTKDKITLGKPTRQPTIRDLLTHTSGITSAWPAGLAEVWSKRDKTLAEVVMAVSQRPLDFEPGSQWRYCNPGMDTLGRVIEVASGQSYENFLASRIFGPLKMTDTVFYPTPAQHARTAKTYDRKEGRLIEVPFPLFGPTDGAKYPAPAGGLYSTAGDLSRFYRMMLNRGTLDGVRVLSEGAVAAMTSVHTGDLKPGFVDGMGFGFGWGVVREPKGVTASLSPGSYGHGGAFGTQAWLDPVRDSFSILLIQRVNMGNVDNSELRKRLQEYARARIEASP